LADYFSKKNISCHITKEPTNGLIGGLIRGQLTNAWHSGPECLQLLFASDRAYHLEKEILPLLNQGISVITDRYFFSTIAFGSTDVDDWNWLKEINKHFIQPDLTFILKASPETCLSRINKNRFNLELFEKIDVLKKVSLGYERIAQEFDKIIIIDGEKSLDEVSAQIIEAYNDFFIDDVT
jgi:dTMP kinase